MPEIIPALLIKDAETFRTRLKLVEGLVQTVQIDCMDGHFVDNRTWYDAEPTDTTLEIELHLMVSDPVAVIRAWKRIPQFVRAIWHVEIGVDHASIIKEYKTLGLEIGLALSPETSMERIAPYADAIDEVLILGVNPGWSGQALIPSTLEKADEIKHRWPGMLVGFDGGVTEANLKDVLRHPIDRLCIASAIFESADPRLTLRGILNRV